MKWIESLRGTFFEHSAKTLNASSSTFIDA